MFSSTLYVVAGYLDETLCLLILQKQIDNNWHTQWITIFKLGAWETLWQSHLLAGVPIQSRPLQDEPETLPLLGDEDAALFSLLPQPAITVGHAQLAARHAPSTHGRCHSCKDQIAEVVLYRKKQRFYWRLTQVYYSFVFQPSTRINAWKTASGAFLGFGIFLLYTSMQRSGT